MKRLQAINHLVEAEVLRVTDLHLRCELDAELTQRGIDVYVDLAGAVVDEQDLHRGRVRLVGRRLRRDDVQLRDTLLNEHMVIFPVSILLQCQQHEGTHEFAEILAGGQLLCQQQHQIPAHKGRAVRGIVGQLLHDLNVDFVTEGRVRLGAVANIFGDAATLDLGNDSVVHPTQEVAICLHGSELVGRRDIGERLLDFAL
mmetsp:Transcript_22115/g.58569  ORF Transcript_22115/g.58569 Transcript_22115/m.58569 type:complete len:200 (+) Transcript_22115:1083-1682(+)